MLLKLFFYTAVLLIAILGYRSFAHAPHGLAIGEDAPDFTLNDAAGKSHSLSDYRGRYLVLYFYPKDDTPGCTKEACHFRDDLSQLEKLGAKVIGVSVDSSESHGKFAEKYKLPFTLLADTDGKVADSYHALSDFFVVKIAKRHTFLIDADGKIKKTYTNVNVSNHSQQIIDDLKTIQNMQ
ncbi:peroxiredoxin [Methylotenera sp. G11]|uniref:peroxiredoxin n=1 Tax=Methylotenera sp. G11 TaxID=1506585 RepID=UPI000647FAEE|nr:peroxiredoxin [Methylotenera sp. G11]